MNTSELYTETYFEDRTAGADPLREAAYAQEVAEIEKRAPQGGRILDVGCALGAFLAHFPKERWQSFGIEVSDYARSKAGENGVVFLQDPPDNYFDVIVWRGVFQHMETPMADLLRTYAMLKPGGLLAILATPNTNAVCYRLFGDLPMLDPPRNFVLPSDTMLHQILTNLGMKQVEVQRPYLQSPYARPVRDHFYFALRLLGFKKKFAFWGNMINVFARK